MNYPPSHPKYLPPRKHWLERKGIIKVEPVQPIPPIGWLIYLVIGIGIPVVAMLIKQALPF